VLLGWLGVCELLGLSGLQLSVGLGFVAGLLQFLSLVLIKLFQGRYGC
jgi:hypothetical protein